MQPQNTTEPSVPSSLLRHPRGFILAPRGEDGQELILANRCAFVLLYVIAMRARRTPALNRYNLQVGEAMIGDYQNYGMSEQEYRTAKEVLKKFNLATFKPTTKGTIATLINASVFDINASGANEQNNGQPTNGQRTPNERVTTNNKEKNGKNEEKGEGAERESARKLWELDTIKKTKQAMLERLEREHKAEVAGAGNCWDTDEARQEAKELRSGIRKLERQIARMA